MSRLCKSNSIFSLHLSASMLAFYFVPRMRIALCAGVDVRVVWAGPCVHAVHKSSRMPPLSRVMKMLTFVLGNPV